MTNKTDAGKTPATVAGLATTPQVLDSGQMILIGLSGGAKGYHALVRLPGGRIKKVTAGDHLSWGRVVAIDENGLLYHRSGETARITLPGG